MKLIDKIKNYYGVSLLLAAGAAVTFNSCSEDIDESDLYTFTGEMMIDHFENNPEVFSSYLTVLGKVHPSKQSPSTMHELLDARGSYTCFAPTNEAVQKYLDSLLVIGEVETTDVTMIPDSVAEDIVFNSLIENQSYLSTDFKEGELDATNMNDRYISISTVSENAQTVLMVNVDSRIIEKDIEVENGVIHAINRVLSPSRSTIADLIIATPNTQMFGDLLKQTGWDLRLMQIRDEKYEEYEERGTIVPGKNQTSEFPELRVPEHRKIGYTIFVEPDSIFEENGIEPGENFIPSLKAWLKENAYYDENTSYGDDYTSEDNAINQFVAYHILPQDLPFKNLVIYSNEKGYTNANPNTNQIWRTNVWEYYETMGKHRRSLKITGTNNGRRLNRYSVYRVMATSTAYVENSSALDPDLMGFTISQTNQNYKTDAINGHYYTINGMHVWHERIPNKVLNERMRYDVCALLPEMMTNNCRYNKAMNNQVFKNDYFANIPLMTDETEFIYLPNSGNSGSVSTTGGSWMNYQTDEFNIQGIYDFTLKLPPVPFTDTYEIRYGLNINGDRGMAQVYIGENMHNLTAVGIPLDLRVTDPAITGWVSDDNLTADEIEENDKAMRNNGYMKGPKYFWPSDSGSGRDSQACLRRIIYTGQLEAGKTYYIRFKSVLESPKTEFCFDYLEFVPKAVYNGDTAEDKW